MNPDAIKDHGGPAFPMPSPGSYTPSVDGMTLRDYFAAHSAEPDGEIPLSLAEQLAGRNHPSTGTLLDAAVFWADAEAAYRYLRADAMLKARQV